MIFYFLAKLIHLNSRWCKYISDKKIINDFGEKIHMKSNWIETTEYHCQCRGSQTLSTTSSSQAASSCQSWFGLELLNCGATALIGRDGVCACARACVWEELVAPGRSSWLMKNDVMTCRRTYYFFVVKIFIWLCLIKVYLENIVFESYTIIEPDIFGAVTRMFVDICGHYMMQDIY